MLYKAKPIGKFTDKYSHLSLYIDDEMLVVSVWNNKMHTGCKRKAYIYRDSLLSNGRKDFQIRLHKEYVDCEVVQG